MGWYNFLLFVLGYGGKPPHPQEEEEPPLAELARYRERSARYKRADSLRGPPAENRPGGRKKGAAGGTRGGASGRRWGAKKKKKQKVRVAP